ncbi:hypothetical protein EMCRGX_G004622 [Ephydatia muelleri]
MSGQHKRGCQWPLSKTSALPVSLLSLEIGPDTCLTCGARATLTRECCPCMVTSMPSSRVALVMSSIWRLQMSKMPFVPGKVCRVRAESAARSLSMIVGVMAVRRQRGGMKAASISKEDGNRTTTNPASYARAKALDEMLKSEIVYVDQLKHIVEGYLQNCRTVTKLFTVKMIELIFGNIERIHTLHKEFLVTLETEVNREKTQPTRIGLIFAVNETKFRDIYVEYYNNHPHSVHMMDLLKSDDKYALFFESCRLLANLHTSLDSYLLAPLHRIGTYPILLSELLRCTSDDHPDYRDIATAIEMMKGVIRLINEHKRRLENIVSIAQWQETISNWTGGDIYERAQSSYTQNHCIKYQRATPRSDTSSYSTTRQSIAKRPY